MSDVLDAVKGVLEERNVLQAKLAEAKARVAELEAEIAKLKAGEPAPVDPTPAVPYKVALTSGVIASQPHRLIVQAWLGAAEGEVRAIDVVGTRQGVPTEVDVDAAKLDALEAEAREKRTGLELQVIAQRQDSAGKWRTMKIEKVPLVAVPSTEPVTPGEVRVDTVAAAIEALARGERDVVLAGGEVEGTPLRIGSGQMLTVEGVVKAVRKNGTHVMVRMSGEGPRLVIKGTLDGNDVGPQLVNVEPKTTGARVNGGGTLTRSLHNGIGGSDCKDTIIENLTIDDCAGPGAHPVYFSGPIDGLTLRGSRFRNNRGSQSMAKVRANNADGSEVRNILIEDNVFEDRGTSDVISLDDRAPEKHETDEASNDRRRLFDVTIRGNQMVGKAASGKIRLRDCERGAIESNVAAGYSLDNNVGVEVRE